jgi:hypothetical protein
MLSRMRVSSETLNYYSAPTTVSKSQGRHRGDRRTQVFANTNGNPRGEPWWRYKTKRTTTGIRALRTRGTYAVRHDVQTVVGRIATTYRAVLRSRRAYIGSIVAGAADCTIYGGPKKRQRTRLQMKDTAPKRYRV